MWLGTKRESNLSLCLELRRVVMVPLLSPLEVLALFPGFHAPDAREVMPTNDESNLPVWGFAAPPDFSLHPRGFWRVGGSLEWAGAKPKPETNRDVLVGVALFGMRRGHVILSIGPMIATGDPRHWPGMRRTVRGTLTDRACAGLQWFPSLGGGVRGGGD